MAPSVSVFVQCPALPRDGFERCRSSIEASDIGTQYVCAMQQPGVGVFEHFLTLLDTMADADTELVVRLEDDVDVNVHFVHNVATWPALHDPRFGLGWLFDPGGRTTTVHDRVYNRPPSHEIWECRQLAYSLAVVMWRKDVPAIRKSCASWYEQYGGNAQDLALSVAPNSFGKSVVVHAPSLVEHMIDMGSTLHHQHNVVYATSRGTFLRDWKRGAPLLDSVGRVVGVM
jgi:hypothetical protein